MHPPTLRKALRTLWLIPLAAFGFLLAATPHNAAADGLPLPTVTVPSLPVTLPTVPLLPTTTAGTGSTPTGTTTAPVTDTVAASTASAAPTGRAGSGTTVAGERRLANGVVSIPVSSVRAPTRLVIVVSVQPRRILRAAQPIKASVEVRDTRGYVVRDATVSIRSVPSGKLVPVRQKPSAANGRVAFVARLRSGKLRSGTLVLRVRASDPAASATTAATRDVRLVVRTKH